MPVTCKESMVEVVTVVAVPISQVQFAYKSNLMECEEAAVSLSVQDL